MTDSMNNISAYSSINRQKLEEVTSFKYLGGTLCKDGTCSAEIRNRIASAIATTAIVNSIWRCNTISFASKFKLCKFVTSILLYGCETWTLLAKWKKRIQASKQGAWGNFSASPTWSTRLTIWRGARSTSMWVLRNLFWHLSRDRN